MQVKLNVQKLNEIMKTFYEMNGIKIALFDSEYNEIMAYPKERCTFCSVVRSKDKLNALCESSDLCAFEKCKALSDVYVYKCHAGLVEAVMPLRYDGQILGYMMFGQITDIKSKDELRERITAFGKYHGLYCDESGIKYRSKRQIVAASKILEMCAEYIILKEMIEPENNRVITLAKEYIKSHLDTSIDIGDLCTYCGCGRTKLYKMFKSQTGTGIAHYTNELRLKKARQLLKTTKATVSEISEKCGFCDYNYFSRVYTKRYGKSPRNERVK